MSTQLNSSTSNLHCGFCSQVIADNLNIHHVKPRSEGGTDEPENLLASCVSCHRRWHQTPRSDGLSDFQRWGKRGGELSALTKRWAHNLKYVRHDSYYQPHRDFYNANYARA